MNELELLSRQLTNNRSRPALRNSSHCRLEKDDFVGNYQVSDVLGTGRFAKVWSARRQNSNVAIKIYRVGGGNRRYYENEVKILNHLLEFSVTNQFSPPNIVGYLGTFAHVAVGHDKIPRIHPCILFSQEGDSLSKLLKFCKKQYDNGIPINVVKKIIKEVLTGLAYLHQCNIIHTDIKPANILMNKRVEDLENEEDLTISIADLGSSTFTDDIFDTHVGTTEYIAPEIIIESSYSTPMDIWATFVMCYRLITTDYLFDVYGECCITYGEDVDAEALDGLVSFPEASMEHSNCECSVDSGNNTVGTVGITYNEWLQTQKIDEEVLKNHAQFVKERMMDKETESYDYTHDCTHDHPHSENSVWIGLKPPPKPDISTAMVVSDESDSSNSSGSEDSSNWEKVNYRHLLLIAKVIGYPPSEFTRNARTYYNRRDRLKNNPDVSPITISELLYSNYNMTKEDCQNIEDFLLCGLKYLPESRVSAQEALNHPWLNL